MLMFIKKILRHFGIDLVRYHSLYDSVLKHHNVNTIIDVGANDGVWSNEMRKLFPKAQIYAFEPLKDCFEKLQSKFSNDSNFKAFNFALGDKNETTSIQRSAFHPSSSILKMAKLHKDLYPKSAKTKTEQIKVRKLDSVDQIILKPDILIKMDVQGFEDKVISGGQNILSNAKILIIETSFVTLYENQPLFDDIQKQLNALNFNYKGNCGEHFSNITKERVYEDSIFVNIKI
jgi:FkbM family methyltransferase